MAKFDYNDIVRIADSAPAALRPGSRAWVVGITEEPREGSHFAQFHPEQCISSNSGKRALDIHEAMLEMETG